MSLMGLAYLISGIETPERVNASERLMAGEAY
jgi:hypothetical protein